LATLVHILAVAPRTAPGICGQGHRPTCSGGNRQDDGNERNEPKQENHALAVLLVVMACAMAGEVSARHSLRRSAGTVADPSRLQPDAYLLRDDGSHILIIAVPEPGTWAVSLAGVAVMGDVPRAAGATTEDREAQDACSPGSVHWYKADMLDLLPLQAAIGALARALSVTGDVRRWQQFDAETQEALRAGVIQTFEVAYEQSWKMMRRWLSANPVAGDVDGVPMRQLFRVAAKAGLIDDVERWMDFHAARNQSSHTYNQAIAQTVFELAPVFAEHVRAMLVQLEKRND
jgi:nucleotidyltransferase substrate binding protein (TIGR01987 family)